MPDTERNDGYGGKQRAAGNADMVETLIADGAQITSPGNYSVPKWGGSCHPLTSACGNTILIVRYTDEDIRKGGIPSVGTSGRHSDTEVERR